MKKIAFLCLSIISFISCNLDDDQGTQFKLTPVTEIIAQQALDGLQKGDTLPIRVDFLSPTICHRFNKFLILKEENNESEITLVTESDEEICALTPNTTPSSTTYNFVAGNASLYILNFWQGQDDAGVDQFLRLEIPVIQTP